MDLSATVKLILDNAAKLHAVDGNLGVPFVARRDGCGGTQVYSATEHSTIIVTLDSVRDLAGWLKKHAQPVTTHILVGQDEIVALLDARHPRSHRAIGNLLDHPLWKRWSDVLGRALTQKQLLALLRSGWGEIKDDLRAEKLRAAMGALTVRTGTTFKAEVDERGMTRLAAADANNVIDQPIPDAFELIAPLFVGVVLTGDGDTRHEPVYRVGIEVSVDVQHGQAFFTLNAPNLEVVELRAREDVAECLRQQLDDRGWLVGLGTLRVETWTTIDQERQPSLASDPVGAWWSSPHIARMWLTEPDADGPFPMPTHDDGNCGPAQADGIAEAPDHS
jgi:hypothetical protein